MEVPLEPEPRARSRVVPTDDGHRHAGTRAACPVTSICSLSITMRVSPDSIGPGLPRQHAGDRDVSSASSGVRALADRDLGGL